MRILLANPRGFCAGVDRAVLIVQRVLETFGAPVFVRHEIVHNPSVVQSLKAQGAVFVAELAEIPDGAPVVFSAHGVPPSVYREAEGRGLRFFDATCPLVTKVHLEIAARSRDGYAVIVIGHANHPEIVGTLGYYDTSRGGGLFLVKTEQEAELLEVPDPDRLAYVTQTTLSVTDTTRIVAVLTRRFPRLAGPPEGDVCYATESRQQAVHVLASRCKVVLVIGGAHSSNAQRLIEVAEQSGAAAHLIQGGGQVQLSWFQHETTVGVTSAASTPECAVQEVVNRIRELCPGSPIETFGEPESVVFRLPRELMAASRASL